MTATRITTTITTKIFVRPRTGLTLRDPKTGRVLPPEGASVVEDNFWRRRICDGDVTVVAPTPGTPAPAAPSTDAHGGS